MIRGIRRVMDRAGTFVPSRFPPTLLGPRQLFRGQALVEFTFVCIMLMALIFGVLDLGQAVISYNMVAEAARAGARAGMISQTSAAVDAAAYAEVDQSLNDLRVTNTVFCTMSVWPNCPADPKSPDTIGPYVLVTVSATYHPITGNFLGIPATIALTASSKRYFPNENAPAVPTDTPTPSGPSDTPTATPTLAPPTNTPTLGPPTNTPTPGPTNTNTPVPSSTPTPTATPKCHNPGQCTPTPTIVPSSPTATNTPVPTGTPTATYTPGPPTNTPLATATSTNCRGNGNKACTPTPAP